MKRLRGYSLISCSEGIAYDFVIAYNIKEAKKLMIDNCSDWIHDGENAILEYYARWNKNADIKGLEHKEHVEGIELIKRKICSSLQYETCPLCKKVDVDVCELDNGTICCETCELKSSGFKKEDKE